MKVSFTPAWLTKTKVLAAVAVTGFLAGCQPQESPELLLARNTPLVVKPLYDNLSAQLETLHTRAESYCRAPDSKSLMVLQDSWHQAMSGWQAASVVNFGPMSQGSMNWKFQFWPDKKNLVRQRVEKAIASDKTWNLTTIGKASVVARGMGAAEYLLFDKDGSAALATEPARCLYLTIVAADMERNARRLSKGWQLGQQRYPSELVALANEEENDLPQISGLLVNSLYSALELAHRKLAMPAGKEGSSGNPYLAESWRSGASLQNTYALLNAAEMLYFGGEGYGIDDSLKAKSETGRLLAKEVEQRFASARQAVVLDTPFTDLLTSKSPRVQDMMVQVAHLKDLFGKQIPEVLEIPLSFNANDGD